LKKLVTALRLVLDQPVATSSGTSSGGSLTTTVFLSGLSSLLTVGVYVAFFPKVQNTPGSFAGCTFQIFPFIEDTDGAATPSDLTAINNGGSAQAAPGGWEGSSTLAQLRITSTVADLSVAGTWKAVVVVEPEDPAMSAETFADLARNVGLSAGSALPTSIP
jgi:hypothetical protein